MSSLKVSVAAEFFDDDCFSNLIIELKGKSIKVNTVILCNNGLFHELCKPDRGLKVSHINQ